MLALVREPQAGDPCAGGMDFLFFSVSPLILPYLLTRGMVGWDGGDDDHRLDGGGAARQCACGPERAAWAVQATLPPGVCIYSYSL